MRMYDVILKKRNGGKLTQEEIEYFIQGCTRGTIPDYQVSALLMAIYLRGMDHEETAWLTDAMAHSGDMMDLSRFGTLSADKHSTGGVGDKTSLIVMPICASLGAKVTKMTGRGLGHTGGTADKLLSIPGYRITLCEEEFLDQVDRIGIALVGQSRNLTPADKKLYALRDVTATVDSIPLITSSIMSKKLAAGSYNIALDVKTGSGAFMKTPEKSAELAREMVDIGKRCGRNTQAVITDMDQPLGYCVGNSLEVREAVAVLRGQTTGQLPELCLFLAAHVMEMVFGWTHEKALHQCQKAVSSGRAFAKMKEWIGAQGGDVRYLEDPGLFPEAPVVYELKAEADGYVQRMNAEDVGMASCILGAGREKEDDEIDSRAGIVLKVKVGGTIHKGQTAAIFYTADRKRLSEAEERFRQGLVIGDQKPEPRPLIYQVIS